MLFNTPDNCKRITGYGKHDLLGVAMGYKVPLDKVRFVKASIRLPNLKKLRSLFQNYDVFLVVER